MEFGTLQEQLARGRRLCGIQHKFRYATDAGSGTITAENLDEAFDRLRAQITAAMIEDGAKLWVEDMATGERKTLR